MHDIKPTNPVASNLHFLSHRYRPEISNYANYFPTLSPPPDHPSPEQHCGPQGAALKRRRIIKQLC